MKTNQRVTLDHGAELQVVSGWGGAVFTFPANTLNAILEGGRIVEDLATAKRKWVAVSFEAEGGPLVYNTVRDMMIENPKIGVYLHSDPKSYINGNSFERLTIRGPIEAVHFTGEGTPNGKNGINRNHFQDIRGQANDNTNAGFVDIQGKANMFINVRIWDLDTQNKDLVSANLTKTA